MEVVNRSLPVLVANGVLIAMLAIFLGMRIWVRFGLLRQFDWDDGESSFLMALESSPLRL